jgi:ring-1,2-phenylacetyl-CoA epoxidase subunit PaaA
VIKLIADYAEILQVEDLLHCSFHPLRNLARITMPEEKFHAKFGKDFCAELCRTPQGRKAVQDGINRYFPITPAFFGASQSRNNEIYRRWRLKSRSNEEMRADFLSRITELVEGDLGLTLPKI